MTSAAAPASESTQRKGPIWSSVALYYVIACVISWPLFWRAQVLGIPTSFFFLMWGPGIAAVITGFLFRSRHVRTVTFFGTDPTRSLLFYVAPVLVLSIAVGSTAEEVELSATFLAQAVGLTFVYTLGEELGWRGFLQDALRPIPKPGRYVLIGAMWEFWHFTNRIYGNENFLLTLAVSYPVLIIVSWIIGEATDRSKSLCIAVTLHAWGNILFEYSMYPITYVVFLLALPFWIYLLRTWNARESRSATA